MLLNYVIHYYLEDVENPIGRAVNFAIAGLVLLSSAIFVLETYPISIELRTVLDLLDTVVLWIFVVEYLLRLVAANNKLKFVFNLYSIIDLVAILPFFLFTTQVQFVRILRWFRILRLIRFFEGQTILGYVTSEDSAIFTRILFTLFSIIFVYSGLIYQVEHSINPQSFQTFLDAIYFSVATMTTVGFGDITPSSQLGRLFTLLMILTGIALIPWQLGDLIKRLVKTANQIETQCANCGLALHDADARFCKVCGDSLTKMGASCELIPSKLEPPLLPMAQERESGFAGKPGESTRPTVH